MGYFNSSVATNGRTMGKTKEQQASNAQENGSACSSFCKEGPMASLTQPIAGPFLIKLFYNFILLCVFGFFIYCIAEAAPTWNKPIVEVQTKFVKELAYPDMYMCIPPLGMATIIEDSLDFSVMGLAKKDSGASAQDICRGFSEMKRVRLSLTMDQDYVDCQSQMGISDERAISEGKIFTNEKTPSEAGNVGGLFKQAKDITGGSPFKLNNDSVNLAKALGTFKDPMNPNSNEVAAFCFSFTGSNTTAKYDSNNVLMNVNALKLNMATAAELLYMNAYFVPKGEKPYKEVDGKFVPTATSVLWPLKNSLTQAQLTTEVITDTSTKNKNLPEEERVYSEKPTTRYKVNVNSQPTRLTVFNDEFTVSNNQGQLQMVDSIVYGGNSIRFGSFVQQHIVIRDKTNAEIWAEIGGLWAGAAIFLTFFFKNSGYTTEGVPEDIEEKHGKPLMVPRFLPGSIVKSHLAKYTQSNKEQEAAEAAAAAAAANSQKSEKELAKVTPEASDAAAAPSSEEAVPPSTNGAPAAEAL